MEETAVTNAVSAVPPTNAEGEAMIQLDPTTQKFLWVGIGTSM